MRVGLGFNRPKPRRQTIGIPRIGRPLLHGLIDGGFRRFLLITDALIEDMPRRPVVGLQINRLRLL